MNLDQAWVERNCRWYTSGWVCAAGGKLRWTMLRSAGGICTRGAQVKNSSQFSSCECKRDFTGEALTSVRSTKMPGHEAED
jgi:hypothetical protein